MFTARHLAGVELARLKRRCARSRSTGAPLAVVRLRRLAKRASAGRTFRELTQVLDPIVGAQHVDFAVTHSTPE
jgi:hypothetical protein